MLLTLCFWKHFKMLFWSKDVNYVNHQAARCFDTVPDFTFSRDRLLVAEVINVLS